MEALRQENFKKVEQLNKEKEALRKQKDDDILKMTHEQEEMRKKYETIINDYDFKLKSNHHYLVLSINFYCSFLTDHT